MNWLENIALRTRILAILSALVVITFSGGAIMIWYTYRMEDLHAEVINTDVAALERAEELELELLRLKGFVSYFFISGDAAWLEQLNDYRRQFKKRLDDVQTTAHSPEERQILSKLSTEYYAYENSKDRVIELYKSGKREQGAKLHEKVREHFFKILQLTGDYRELHKSRIQDSLTKSRMEARRYRVIAAGAMSSALVLAALLAFVLIVQVLGPIRALASTASRDRDDPRSRDEVADLDKSVRGLIEDMGHTQIELERSRARLYQSEKMAVVGKLAADVAHSIRNPMTSIKMRLFSLERSLDLSSNQAEDFEVVSEEMRRLDNIVRNFLEFSRPPKLKMQKINVADAVEGTLQLLQHRIEMHDVKIGHKPNRSLPEVEADPELLKEVLVNFIVNALDAMENGGRINISEEEGVAEEIGRAIMVRIQDTGPGIPASLQEKVFEPFFSTKEDGTGLGLSIAERIIEEHGGRLVLRSKEGAGTTFIISLPVKEEGSELDTYS